MKIISIGSDIKLFEENSQSRVKQIEYGKLFDRVDIIVFSNKSQNFKTIQISDNVFIHPTNSRNKLFYVFDAFNIGRKIIKEFKSDVVSTQDPFESGLVGLKLKFLCELALQVQVHTDFSNKYFILHSPLNVIRFIMAEVILSFADSVRVVSDRVKKSVHNLPEHISLLPVYIPILALPTERIYEKDAISILTVSRLEKEKDLKTAILAFKKLIDSGISAEFIIVGDGMERKSLEDFAKNLELSSKVIFKGWQNPQSYYSRADIYISTSLYEGYGMSIVEASQHASALVISDAGISDYFVNGESAFIVKPRDVNGFADALKKLALDSDLRKKMGEKAKKIVQRNLISKEDYLNKYKGSLKEALKVKNSGIGIFKRNILLRYFVAGFTAAFTNIFLLYVFTEFLKIWYVYSSALSFIVALFISFILQKFWTFADKEITKAHRQFIRYFLVGIFGVLLNTLLIYIFVEFLGVWYILGQIFTGVIIAVINFFLYKMLIFKK